MDTEVAEKPIPDSELLSDPKHLRDDCQLIVRAVRERWPMEEDFRERLLKVLLKIAEHPEKERHALSAARALASMDRDNVAAGATPAPSAVSAVQVNINNANPIDDLHARIVQATPRVSGDSQG